MAVTYMPLGGRSVQAVFTTANESAPTLATEGLNLADLNGFSVHVSADSGQTFTAVTGGLAAYIWDELINAWARAPELDLTIQAGAVGTRRCSFTGFTVSSPRGRLAYIPASLAVSSGGVTIVYACSALYGDRT